MLQLVNIVVKIKEHAIEMLQTFPEIGVMCGISPLFVDIKTALQYTGVIVTLAISIVTLAIKLKELKDKYK